MRDDRAPKTRWIAPKRDLTPGLDWSGQIVEALEQSAVVVLVYSAHANGSHQVKREIERGVSLGLPLIPMRIDDAPMSKVLEARLEPPLARRDDAAARAAPQLAETVEYLSRSGATSGRGSAPAPPPARPRSRRSLLDGAAAVVLVGAGAAAWLALRPHLALDPLLAGAWGPPSIDQRAHHSPAGSPSPGAAPSTW
ncbi:MAG: toll/interleukin-1 receptor domain-containing protein [Gemmatimonadales bacterium]